MKEDRLFGAVKQMADLPDEDKTNIKGKLYAEVHTRIQAFREAYGADGKIITKVHQADEEKVLTETTIHVFEEGSWRTIANDFAEEYRGVGMVNKTSAVENCITSSIGRALSACGLSGGNYASFEEVDHAIKDKAEAPSPKKKAKPKPKPKAKAKVKEESTADDLMNYKIKSLESANEFVEIFLRLMAMSDTTEALRNYYKANIKTITVLKDEYPELKKELDEIITKKSEELSATKEKTNGR
jgi:hypothetical protein